MYIKQRHLSFVLVVGIAVLGLVGCDSAVQDEETSAPVQVSVMTLKNEELLVTKDLPGRVAAVRSAEIRAQISGIVQGRLFEQGAEITSGTVLFQINPAPFKADVDIAAAALLRAEAVWVRARQEADRLASLIQTEAVSQQMYDDAISQRDQAAADVAQTKATLARRQLDLQFASVEAPISGRIDEALVSEGALVSPTDTTPMARIQQIDQVYVDVRLPASMLKAMRQQANSGAPELAVEILSSSGEPLGMQGHILFSGIQVDAGTGDVLLRVLVDNPQHRLLPGLYVKARIPQTYYPTTLNVPQQAVTRKAGQPQVWVLDEQAKVQPVAVKVDELVAGHYHVVSGLSAGQQIVVEGIERLSPAAQVVARPWQPTTANQQLSAVVR
ncbi:MULTISPECIES: efflux RND transporter periplasmic adaptor subunit [Shewanella]|uniref:Efflux transporter, RND family, MFP subunit n=1 Tax=Shewanella putrefaciens (strain CN-32 / ATCC BAA-453) TaxID=319224 RepID=A4YCJ2_SHEPC|nr:MULTISPECIES: efflux RND transporter periplasmic adaptor subunit [Shewanella]ABM26870.1 efflux transporter, RND family, MFP subunit [Shewanella sp. W3-18-1]QGS47998.1 efflux RND transporter periplasmic adaptor subunit [Shewanella putrefaciens]CAD6365180.1 Multidrug export protein AcrE [Shewanella hafniensis]